MYTHDCTQINDCARADAHTQDNESTFVFVICDRSIQPFIHNAHFFPSPPPNQSIQPFIESRDASLISPLPTPRLPPLEVDQDLHPSVFLPQLAVTTLMPDPSAKRRPSETLSIDIIRSITLPAQTLDAPERVAFSESTDDRGQDSEPWGSSTAANLHAAAGALSVDSLSSKQAHGSGGEGGSGARAAVISRQSESRHASVCFSARIIDAWWRSAEADACVLVILSNPRTWQFQLNLACCVLIPQSFFV